MTKTVLLNVSQIQTWAQTHDVQFVSGSRDLPYVKAQDSLFYYFGFVESERSFHLIMTSERDLGLL